MADTHIPDRPRGMALATAAIVLLTVHGWWATLTPLVAPLAPLVRPMLAGLV